MQAGGITFPLWQPQSHINYMLRRNCSDLIISSDNSESLLSLKTTCQINLVAALGWSGVREIRKLFEAGYSKVFLGGASRPLPSRDEANIFAEMVSIYGASSFGYTLHFEDIFPEIDPIFLNQFNEILIVEKEVQLYINQEKCTRLANEFDKKIRRDSLKVNLCAPEKNYETWSRSSKFQVNYVNYCEHGIARVR